MRFIISPKTSMVWIYNLAGEEYLPGESSQAGESFQAGQRLISSAFPEVNLKVDQMVKTGQES
ncbi:MAG TPA: hypothetical protein VLS96_03915 [Nodosilinea sp.]|nr:hypothetical protein [Nodosilinea sp.]